MGVDRERVMEALDAVQVTGLGRHLQEIGVVRGVEVEGGTVRVRAALPEDLAARAGELEAALREALGALEGVESVEVDVQLVRLAPAPAAAPRDEGWTERLPGVRHVVAVASGKGGVGKSTVTANLAVALARMGRRVAVLDGDIYGPSQQLMMAPDRPPAASPQGRLLPPPGPGGVPVMSLGLLIEPDQPVIWRGPMLMKAMEQLVGDVEWGELDELLVDLPPGTGDVAITLCQKLALAGAIVVTTPQDVALIDARKALAMFRKMDAPVLGIVENMAGYTCPRCGHTEPIFGEGGGRRTAESLGVPLLGAIPLDPAVVTGGDRGEPVVLTRPSSPAARAFTDLAAAVAARLDGRT